MEGLGLDLKGGTFNGPGFVLSTWTAWQALCEEVVRRALPDQKVVGQLGWELGLRGTETVYATPDISPLVGGVAPFLLDAKYKTRAGRTPSITSADLYESLAFLRAAATSDMYLLYPARESTDTLALGAWKPFDRVDVDTVMVEGIELQVQGISSRGGFDRVVAGARAALLPKV